MNHNEKIPYCPTCGMPLAYGHFRSSTMEHYWWCRNPACQDHTAPVVIPA